MTYTRCGQEILCDGRHFADAVSQEAAETIMAALCGPAARTTPQPSLAFSDGPLFADIKHRARREGDEMVCMCGKRWDYREEHP